MPVISRSPESLVIDIEAVIGAGKSTLLNILEQEIPNAFIIKEPIEEWEQSGMFRKYCDDKHRWAYTFQTDAMLSRIEECERVVDRANKSGIFNPIFFSERSIFSDKLFTETLHEEGAISDLEYKCYERWFKRWGDICPAVPDIILYLQTDHDTTMKRIIGRGRQGEIDSKDINIENLYENPDIKKLSDFQLHLRNKHDLYFGADESETRLEIIQGKTISVFKINVTENYRDDLLVRERIVTQIKNIIDNYLKCVRQVV